GQRTRPLVNIACAHPLPGQTPTAEHGGGGVGRAVTGKGEWTDQVEQLRGLLARFYEHITRYERIFTLRRLRDKTLEHYELVEIPKNLLEHARDGDIRIDLKSKQTPKPGFCTVTDAAGVAFRLYFDGGTERKLQVRALRKNLCYVHATWRFPRQDADAPAREQDAEDF
ncbi:MAG: hypothetical protein ACREFA_18580, partial [Stellaceae bacterium]